MNVDDVFRKNIADCGLTYSEYLEENEKVELGRLLFGVAPASIRAEALVECDEFDKYSRCMFEDELFFALYCEGVFRWMFDIYADRYDDYIGVEIAHA